VPVDFTYIIAAQREQCFHAWVTTKLSKLTLNKFLDDETYIHRNIFSDRNELFSDR